VRKCCEPAIHFTSNIHNHRLNMLYASLDDVPHKCEASGNRRIVCTRNCAASAPQIISQTSGRADTTHPSILPQQVPLLSNVRGDAREGLGIKHRGGHLYEEGPRGGGHEALAVHVGNLRWRRRHWKSCRSAKLSLVCDL
jgi:hypothetical protein